MKGGYGYELELQQDQVEGEKRTDEETRALLNAHPTAMALIQRMREQLARMEGKIRELETLLPPPAPPAAKGGQ